MEYNEERNIQKANELMEVKNNRINEKQLED